MNENPLQASRPRMRVINEIRRLLDAGHIAAGAMLPTEQALCAQLRVSRGTVRAALKQLESDGVLRGEKGLGRIRGRIVTTSLAAQNPLMAKTIVLFTHVAGGPKPRLHSGDLHSTDSGAADAIQSSGMHMFVMHWDALTEAGMDHLLANAPAAVVVGPAVADYAVHRELLLRLYGRIPLIVGSADKLWESCDRVISDHAVGAAAVARWLVTHGRKRILRVFGASKASYWVRDRNRGFEAVMSDSRLPVLAPVYLQGIPVTSALTHEAFELRARQTGAFLIEHLRRDQAVDAIVAASDSEASYIAACCRLFGLEPNKDVWIAGYDNYWKDQPERAWEPSKPVVTVDKLNHTLGEEMVRCALERIAGSAGEKPRCIVLEPKLIVANKAIGAKYDLKENS